MLYFVATRALCLGTFPHPVSLGARAVGWVESEIESWISRKITESRVGSPANANREAR